MPKVKVKMTTEPVEPRFDFVDGELMVKLTDFVRTAYSPEVAWQVRDTLLYKEALFLPGLKRGEQGLMIPIRGGARLLAKHGELPGSVDTLKILIRKEASLRKRVEWEEREKQMRELIQEAWG